MGLTLSFNNNKMQLVIDIINGARPAGEILKGQYFFRQVSRNLYDGQFKKRKNDGSKEFYFLLSYGGQDSSYSRNGLCRS